MGLFDDISPFNVLGGGYFNSRGIGTHPTRTIDSYELIFVTSGKLNMFEGDYTFEISPGGTLLLQPGVLHGGTADYPVDLKFYWQHFLVKKPEGDALLQSLPKTQNIIQHERMAGWFRRLISDTKTGALTSNQAGMLFTLMLSELVTIPDDPEMFIKQQLAVKAHDYVKLNFEQPISTAVVAELLQCNPDYLGRIFKKAYGMTLTMHINVQRIRYAKKMLLTSVHNINQIAEQSGFNDIAYFRRMFKKATGMTPSVYRKQYCKVHINTE